MKIQLAKIWRAILSSRLNAFSFFFLLFLIILSVAAPLFPFSPTATDVTNVWQGPSLSHWFGTDDLGRDYFIRVIYGGRVSLIVAISAMLASTFIGTLVGVLSGYFGGWVDNILMRLVEILSSIPWLVLVIVLSVFLRPSLTTIIIVIGGFSWMGISRLIRAEILSVKNREYVVYSEFIGESRTKIILRHIIPNILPTLIVAATNSISSAIMTESALSFLGMGIQHPMSSWGSLLQNAQSSLQRAPYMAILPGLFVLLTIYSINNLSEVFKSYIQREV
ncbi:ABC transporter permease [Streptococcus chenjunshii]|uniref:ABC transporter permease n=1 Tax=Streptococcus chenjunshii TaxID=2173853 RepID=A0A372KJ25_9STRE|nr:ABC transporter permease [Streptococcus chenjunshii]AXQ79341.1 ABC transporter permease [Streptococcus chenjunshii]RFU50133.1 ABC transporter permease [Streptococcus chenjunshii]RFU52285.1 ABC transporter permease [Streptococcus chenjunshii]